MTEYRKVLADGDLITERKLGGWWFFGDKWLPHRNLSREVRFLEERMHQAHSVYMQCREEFMVAQKNVHMDMDVLRLHKMDNTEIAYITPSDESILDHRDGVNYNQKGNNQKQKGSGNNGGNGNNQQKGGDNGGGNNQNHNQNQQNNKQRGQQKSLLDLLASAKVTLH